jgi:outer membrane protein OmpA-like peptidoglycan-associated protein
MAEPARSKAADEQGSDGPLPPVRNPAVPAAKPRGNYYLPWLLLALVGLIILFLLFRGLSEDAEDGLERRATSEATARAGGQDYVPGTIAGDLSRYLSSSEPAPRTFTFDRLNFDSDSASIRQTDIADLDQLAQVLTAHPATRIAVIGYTDAEGSGRRNARLGAERAESVAEALAARNVARDRIETRSGGEQAPIADNDRREGRAENRRTELIVLSR